MNKLWLLVVAVVAFALPSLAEDCASNASQFNWNAVTVGSWTGCTASNDDDFTIAAGHTVTASQDVTLTTGSVTVNGTLIVPPGVRLTFGTDGTPTNALTVNDGGKLVVQGSIRKKCRVVDVDESSADTAAGAGTVTLTTDCDMTGVDTTAGDSDFVVFGDEDPEDASATIHGPVWYGPGVAPPGVYRPSYPKWAWFDVTAVSGKTITYGLSSEETFASGAGYAAPYAGTRDWPTGTTDPLTMNDTGEVVSLTRQWGGFSTAMRVASGYAEMCAVNGDLGSYYLVFEEGFGSDFMSPSTPSYTAAENGAVNSGDAGTDTVITNIRTRVAEIITAIGTLITELTATDSRWIRDPNYCPGEAYKVAMCERGAPTITFNTADVSTAADTITEAGHAYKAGDLVRVVDGGSGLPTGNPAIAAATNYYIVVVDANTIQLANSLILASAGQTQIDRGGSCTVVTNCIDITAAGGNGNTAVGYVMSLATATADDVVWLYGDASGCTKGDAHLTHGVRRGDIVNVVTPAVLDGDATGAGPAGSVLVSGGELQIDLASLQNIDADMSVAGAVFALAPASASTPITGRFTRSEMWHMGSDDVTAFADSFALYISPPTSPAVTASFSGLTLDRLHIHDTLRNEIGTGSGGGSHGFVEFDGQDVTGTRFRIERMTDDAMAAPLRRTLAASGTPSSTYRQMLLYEAIAGSNNSQECFQPSTFDDLLNDTSSVTATTANTFRVSDVMAVGCFLRVFNSTVGSPTYSRFVGSGSSYGTIYTHYFAPNGNEFVNVSVYNYAPTVRNSVLASFGHMSPAVNGTAVYGDIYDSILFGNNQRKNANLLSLLGDVVWGPRIVSGVVLDADVNAGRMLWGEESGANLYNTRHDYINTLFRHNPSATPALCDNDTTGGGAITINRLAWLSGAPDTTNGWTVVCTNTTNTTAQIDGLFISSLDAGNANRTTWNTSGSSVQNVCVESTHDNVGAAEAFTTLCPTCLNFNALSPEADDDMQIRTMVATGSGEGCDATLPERLGLSEIGVTHTMMGDGFIKQFYNWTSDDIISPTSGGDGSRGGSSKGR